jgi:transposase
VGHTVVDDAPPGASKTGSTSVERGEVVRPRRQLRQALKKRDILAKATAWFAIRGEKTSSVFTNS